MTCKMPGSVANIAVRCVDTEHWGADSVPSEAGQTVLLSSANVTQRRMIVAPFRPSDDFIYHDGATNDAASPLLTEATR